MEETRLETWEAFETIFLAGSSPPEASKKNGCGVSDLLYRGHANATWKLQTTLERFSEKYDIVNANTWDGYHEILKSIAPQVSSFTKNNYEILDFDQQSLSKDVPPAYEFMIYLRHHGFPSPLLDWTISPYVAGFFAFFYASPDTDVAIYSYREYLGQGKISSGDRPKITNLGPYANTHKRHFLQQCQYTICTLEDSSQPKQYSPHEAVSFGQNQDKANKYILPYSERKKVLRKLSLMNINEYSLFGSEESLMSTLAYREIEKR